jgi:hypothetical protein
VCFLSHAFGLTLFCKCPIPAPRPLHAVTVLAGVPGWMDPRRRHHAYEAGCRLNARRLPPSPPPPFHHPLSEPEVHARLLLFPLPPARTPPPLVRAPLLADADPNKSSEYFSHVEEAAVPAGRVITPKTAAEVSSAIDGKGPVAVYFYSVRGGSGLVALAHPPHVSLLPDLVDCSPTVHSMVLSAR